MSDLKVVNWVSWEEGLKYNQDTTEDHTDVLIEYLREHKMVHGGYWHQGACGVPVFSDGTAFMGSLRTWGGIMYEAVNPDGDDGMGYCEYAWSN